MQALGIDYLCSNSQTSKQENKNEIINDLVYSALLSLISKQRRSEVQGPLITRSYNYTIIVTIIWRSKYNV